jgi:multidrug transporter EmrE-like cation transporter
MPVPSVSWVVIGTFALSLVFQVSALLLLPATRGFTQLLPSLLCVGLFAVGLWMLARIIHSGVDVSILIPVSAAFVPIATTIAAVVFFHEPGSVLRVALLLVACALIGVASRVT